MSNLILFSLAFIIFSNAVCPAATAQQLNGYQYRNTLNATQNTIISKTQFNGYTNHWQDDYKKWIRYGNLFKMSVPDVASTIIQNKIDIAEALHVPGFWMQEGFMHALLTSTYSMLENPSAAQINEAIAQGNVLIFIDSAYAVADQFHNIPAKDTAWGEKLKSHQYNAKDFEKINAYYLEKGNNKIFVVAGRSKASASRLKELIANTLEVVQQYDLHKGWFGAQTLLKSVTCTPGHPLEVIGKGMNEGNDWFVFDGYMDFLMKDELEGWIKRSGAPVITDVGFSPIYGCSDYAGLQVQDMGGQEAWIKYAQQKGGYIFRPVYAPKNDAWHYDGYIANAGNKEQIDNENVPFIAATGPLIGDALSSMVLFIKKGEAFTREKMWEAILQRRAVAVLAEGNMMGPAMFRNALQMLLLDRVFPEEYFSDRLDLQATIDGYMLRVTLSNHYDHAIPGTLNVQLPPEVTWEEPQAASAIALPANSSRTITLKIRPTAAGMDKTNPITIQYKWNNKIKSTLAVLDLPPAISVNRLLYGHAPVVQYPVTIHNFSSEASFPVQVQVFEKGKAGKAVFSATQKISTPPGTWQQTVFDLKLPPGDYDVKTSALGVAYTSQLGVGKKEGHAYAYELDLNADGIKEYRLENDSVQVTLLATGARVIEYIVKSRKDNVLFKLWPEKPEDDKRPFRKYGFYPYGGFEDFLGQASMETHQVYDAKLVQKEGDYVQVIMSADYFGNRLEKTFTLYGNSPLLEVRFALNFINPEANVIGPQPILELGEAHGTEDVFIAPDKDSMLHVRMRPEEYFGRVINLKEGWNAGYDTKADISFVGAYPVTQPLFLHMWMNHPSNGESHYYYTEFQPWVPIIQKTTMYFTYYLWGAGGGWEESVKALRKRNLITVR
ncbi:hypothetical protein [Agriterribacter sp.]|uniref:COG1470 family protein n=1 Tax=Agriterribacter sp. TaxID=2821509 RepID=UPI002BAA2FF4|nr:hypothetical protein [Agriterribacter sp.]HRO47529.1 hypothetical protein [Agriterribacter sp.]HRQ17013.1 hypothetical protein [Agriterribacter sp.]